MPRMVVRGYYVEISPWCRNLPPYVPRARVGGSAVVRRERHARTRGTHYLMVCLNEKFFTFWGCRGRPWRTVHLI